MRGSKKVLVLAGVAAVGLVGGPAFAHHSYAMFDNDKTVTIQGTVKEFQWTNPHSFVQVIVKDATTGKDVEWSIEGSSPNGMVHNGWTSHSAVPGDKAAIDIHPLKDGGPGGSLIAMTINGHTFGRRPPGAPPI